MAHSGNKDPDTPVLSVHSVTKDYPGVRALDDVNFDLRRGEIHALVGENGAGKSTLIRILSGDAPPTKGQILLDGQEISFDSPAIARRNGIVTIYQELMIVPGLSVAANVVLGNEPAWGFGRQILNQAQAEQVTNKIFEALGCENEIDPRALAGSLTTGRKQLVEIARALVLKAPIVILDEPTASLSDKEVDALLKILRKLREEGTTILYVSHRLPEIISLADRVTVMRGGRHVATLPTSELSGTGDIINLMVGRPLTQLFPEKNQNIGDVALSVRGLERKGVFRDVSFDVKAGEIVGFAGLVGAGRSETMRAIFGADPIDKGTVLKNGSPIEIASPRDAVRHGIAFIPEDRKDQGLVIGMSGEENLLLASMDDHCRGGFISWRSARDAARNMAERLRFRGQLPKAARTNSGGNQQKLVIGKWMLSKADVFIFDEPTRGIDVGAKAEIYGLIHELANRGAAIVVVSSELPELVHLCHRILVFSAGEIHDEVVEGDFEEERILTAAFKGHATGPAHASPH